MKNSVKKRETFYLAGYDPRGARHYYNLFKKESALQSKVNGMKMDISSRKRTDTHIQSWHITSTTATERKVLTTETDYHFLGFDDIIRKGWKNTTISIFIDLFFYIKIYILSGLIIKFAKLSPAQIIPLMSPVFYLIFTLILAFTIWFMIFNSIIYFIPIALGLIIALVPTYFLVRLMIYIGEKITIFWLLRIYVFSAKYVLEENEELDNRIDRFASHIANIINNAEKNEVDEILIVAHSVGTIMTIPVLAKALNSFDIEPEKMKIISIMTLGECVPLVSFLKESIEFKSNMKTLVSEGNIFWLDYASPIDGACFPLLDYYKHSGIEISPTKGPIYLSPRFHLLYEKERYNKFKKNRFIVHFLYLMSTDKTGDYDYFKITAGHQQLSNSLVSRTKS